MITNPKVPLKHRSSSYDQRLLNIAQEYGLRKMTCCWQAMCKEPMPEMIAEQSFDYAEAMLEEFERRTQNDGSH